MKTPDQLEAKSSPYSIELPRGPLGARPERRERLRRLGRQGRLAAYRRGEFDLDTCSMWAAAYPHEVPLLHGEFEFIARRECVAPSRSR